jgi:hypothetical protein
VVDLGCEGHCWWFERVIGRERDVEREMATLHLLWSVLSEQRHRWERWPYDIFWGMVDCVKHFYPDWLGDGNVWHTHSVR